MEHLIVLRAAFVDLIADIGDIDSTVVPLLNDAPNCWPVLA